MVLKLDRRLIGKIILIREHTYMDTRVIWKVLNENEEEAMTCNRYKIYERLRYIICDCNWLLKIFYGVQYL